ncbi:glycosyltransferase family 2 protein [Peribacillus kribbensis]|uniref:glycosyltransferase family 2 protein n=1 Tax=Peribacillus kribbensis TaxID=356658 RepID=UPI001FE195F7|nr:glycosyltransferase family 2 protein [Peribacillus kribbensis]
MLVSIVIPVYNAAPFLDECLQSVEKQTYPDWEAVIINDGSTDHSEEIVKRYAAAEPRFTLYTQENKGLGFTRNRGIALSKGKYVFFLDSDDTIPEKAIKSLVEAAEMHEADYAVGKTLRISGERDYLTKRQVDFHLYKEKGVSSIRETPEMLQDSIACNKLWKKEFLTEHQLYFTEGKYYEDLHMTMRGALLAGKIAVTPEVVYHWRVRENEDKPSITQQQMRLQNTRDRLSQLQLNREWLLETQADPKAAAEHDLKSLLDVLGLHVLKYALVAPEEREVWLKEVTDFIAGIPGETARRLPYREKRFYDLLMKRADEDLLLFSRMYTGTETEPIVSQKGQNFILKGTAGEYEVTRDLKPEIMVREVRESRGWILKGQLTVPKASGEFKGSFYAEGRKTGVIPLGLPPLRAAESEAVYPFESQEFELNINLRAFETCDPGIYDLYFRLEGDKAQHRPGRVRISTRIKPKYPAETKNLYGILYKTKHGNLSLRITKNTIKTKIKNTIKKIIGRS